MNRYKFISLAQPDANAILMIGNRILIENSDAFAYTTEQAHAYAYAQTQANGNEHSMIVAFRQKKNSSKC